MADVLRFDMGRLSLFRTEKGAVYLRGDFAGLRVTIVEAPDEEPAPGAERVFQVFAHANPNRDLRRRRRRPAQTVGLPPTAFDSGTRGANAPAPSVASGSPELRGTGTETSTAKTFAVASRRQSAEARAKAILDDVRFWYGPLPQGGDDISSLTFERSA